MSKRRVVNLLNWKWAARALAVPTADLLRSIAEWQVPVPSGLLAADGASFLSCALFLFVPRGGSGFVHSCTQLYPSPRCAQPGRAGVPRAVPVFPGLCRSSRCPPLRFSPRPFCPRGSGAAPGGPRAGSGCCRCPDPGQASAPCALVPTEKRARKRKEAKTVW